MIECNLRNPFPNGFTDETDSSVVEHLSNLNRAFDLLQSGELFVKFIDGDREGSIARVASKYLNARRPEIGYGRHGNRFHNDYLFGRCSWDGRRNGVDVTIPQPDLVVLFDYNGPTVWELFDAKAAKAEVLKNPDQVDIDGAKLMVGDKVLYMNLRYGSGGTLQHGTIQEFKAVVDSKGALITTIVKSDHADEVSEIRYPERMIYKKQLI